MSKTCVGHRVILFTAVAFGAVPASAEILLIQIHQVGSSFGVNFIGEPRHMAFVAEIDDSIGQTKFEGWYDSDDVGMTFHATSEVVDAIELALTQPTGNFWLEIHSFPRGPYNADELWRTDWDPSLSDIRIEQFVPRRGVGLTGYNLTAITQTVDLIRYMESGANTITSAQEQTIRIYGQAVPEPTSLLLVLHCVALSRLSRRCRP